MPTKGQSTGPNSTAAQREKAQLETNTEGSGHTKMAI